MTRPGLDITPAPTRRGLAAQPARRILRKLIAPMMGRFVRAHDELAWEHHQLRERVEDSERRLDRLTDEIAAANALAWDQVALARRLSELEDALSDRRA
jgi:hypothetical protein